MLVKTMIKVLNRKINNWLSSITSPTVIDAIKKDLIITGGCMTSMITNEKINDFDCYFRTKRTALLVANYYADLWNESHPLQENKVGARTKVFVLDCDNPSQEILDYYHISNIADSEAIMLSNFDKGRVKIIFPSDGITGDPELASGSEELGVDSVHEIIEELDEVKADEIIEREKKEYFPVFMSSNAITLSNKVQLIVRFYGEPDKIHDTFDFEHTKSYYDCGSGKIVIPQSVWECATNRCLRYTGSKYPVCSMFRLRKFINRGWKINAGQLLKIALQISDLDLTDINVLEDQLIGVDSVYFMQLIRRFKKQKESDNKFELTRGYIESIIDKIF